jgi:hypothetical protein
MHRFTLEPYGQGTRYPCPNCRHRRNTFARYIDTETGEYLANNVGICDRAEKCGYHYPPRKFLRDNPGWRPGTNTNFRKAEPKPIIELPWDYVTQSLKQYKNNNFVQFLVRMFGEEKAMELARKYRIGTSKHWPGATVFWQIDIDFHVRAGKIMLYDNATCRRVKEPFNHITWVHSLLRNAECQMRNALPLNSAIDTSHSDFEIKQCFFGEHLLGLDENKTVAITESEKAAVIASLYFPDYIWIAAGALAWLTDEKCKVLEGRNVWLYPDVNGFGYWRDKARVLNVRMPSTTFRTDRTLELWATDEDRKRGIDLADYWIDEFLSETKC